MYVFHFHIFYSNTDKDCAEYSSTALFDRDYCDVLLYTKQLTLCHVLAPLSNFHANKYDDKNCPCHPPSLGFKNSIVKMIENWIFMQNFISWIGCNVFDPEKPYTTIPIKLTHPWRERLYQLIMNQLQRRHYERDGVSNHQRFDCLLKRLFRRRENIKAPHHWSLWG